MAQEPELTGIQLKLRSTPTAGVEGEHSPYYRRLLSAGYKGFLQGTIGGSTLYGALGLGVGALVAIPAFFLIGPASLTLIPAMGGLGVMKGASTFGNIGSVAAISAESAEMAEKRRYLLDRYHELPDTPEFDQEAKQLQEILNRQHTAEKPDSMFHWKTVAIGAALGAAIAFGLIFMPGVHLLIAPAIEVLGVGLTSTVGVAVGTMLGAAAGATIGLDRFYVRKWFDSTESVVHDPSKVEKAIAARELEVASLGGKRVMSSSAEVSAAPAQDMKIQVEQAPQARGEQAIAPETIAEIKPRTTASNFAHQDRLAEIQQAVARPTL